MIPIPSTAYTMQRTLYIETRGFKITVIATMARAKARTKSSFVLYRSIVNPAKMAIMPEVTFEAVIARVISAVVHPMRSLRSGSTVASMESVSPCIGENT